MHHEHLLSDPMDRPPERNPHRVVDNCECLFPLPVERAERAGAARTHCARCGKPVPLRLSGRP